MSRLFEFHVPDAPPEMVAAERLEAIAADVERTADALERIADAVEEKSDLVTDGGQRTYRKLKGVGSWMDVDRPEWATEYGVGSDITFGTPDGEFTATVVGFSLKDEYEGLPVVYPPDEIADKCKGDILVLREKDVVERELRTDGGREEQCAVAGCPRYPIEGDRCRWHTDETDPVAPLLRSVSQALGLICPDLQNFAGNGSERGFPNRSWQQCYDCRAPTTLRNLRRGEEIYHPDEESMEYEWIDVDLCPRCWMQRYGIPCGTCDRLHPDQEAALRCCAEQRGVLPDGGRPDDDLETTYELRLRGEKHELIEVANVLWEGLKAKTDAGEITPPDHRMINGLTEELHDLLDVPAANQAMAARIETGDVVVGESVTVELVEADDLDLVTDGGTPPGGGYDHGIVDEGRIVEQRELIDRLRGVLGGASP